MNMFTHMYPMDLGCCITQYLKLNVMESLSDLLAIRLVCYGQDSGLFYKRRSKHFARSKISPNSPHGRDPQLSDAQRSKRMHVNARGKTVDEKKKQPWKIKRESIIVRDR